MNLTLGLMLAGNAREPHDPGPPVVTEEQIRTELGPVFDILIRSASQHGWWLGGHRQRGGQFLELVNPVGKPLAEDAAQSVVMPQLIEVLLSRLSTPLYRARVTREETSSSEGEQHQGQGQEVPER